MTRTEKQKPITCYGQYRSLHTTQEWYETASRDAGRRTRECRRAGFRASASGMGPQVTGVGRINMTLVNIYMDGRTCDELPTVQVVRGL